MAALQRMQALPQLTHQPLASRGIELLVLGKALEKGAQLPLIPLRQSLRRRAQGAAHKAAEGVRPALQIAEAPLRLQRAGLAQGGAPGPQAWGGGGQLPWSGFIWLS